MDMLDAVMLLEGGEASEEEQIAAMQSLIDSGVVWQLQGCYGRAAHRLIQAGVCTARKATINEYRGDSC